MHLWQTMTGAARRPGQLLKRRLAGFLRPKCHPILLDTFINSRTTVRLNIYQVQHAAKAVQDESMPNCPYGDAVPCGNCISSRVGELRTSNIAPYLCHLCCVISMPTFSLQHLAEGFFNLALTLSLCLPSSRPDRVFVSTNMQAFMLAAMKFHCYISAMTRRPAGDARMALSVIDAGIAHTVAAIRKFSQLSAARWGVGCETRVSARHVRWLGLTAFQRVLQRKQVPAVCLAAQSPQSHLTSFNRFITNTACTWT